MSRWEKKSGEFGEVKVTSTWDKRTYNSIVVEGDDQKWVLELLITAQLHEVCKFVSLTIVVFMIFI